MITFEDVFTFEHMLASAKECTHGVMWKQSTQNMWHNRYSIISDLLNQLYSGTYKSGGFKEFTINERGKTRRIQAIHITERIVQKTLREYALKPILEPRLIYDNSASIDDKGTNFAIKRLRKHLSTHVRKYGTTGGVLTLDIHNYFGSIDHEILKNQLRKVIADDDINRLSAYFVDCFKGDVGLGLGSEVSQEYAMYYLNPVDHYIKERLYIEGYGRYNDDSYIISPDIEYLKYCKNMVIKLYNKLGLVENPNKTQIHYIGRENIPYLKRRFMVTSTGEIIEKIDKKNVSHRRCTVKKQGKLLLEGEADKKGVEQSYISWRGYATKADSYNTVRNVDKICDSYGIDYRTKKDKRKG